MPRGDGMGPAGWGPMTGRRRGYCVGYYDTPGFVTPGPGMGYGRGWGRAYPAYGPGPMVPAPVYMPRPDPAEERRYLEQCSEDLERELEDLRTRLKQLEEEEK
ncbi:MAG: DUF5320 domain-containing protein, partial [Methanomassiliicoccales archaeon]|nr:DUF5320 domain-containing protein [Methanomassiliicoccales archaeon]